MHKLHFFYPSNCEAEGTDVGVRSAAVKARFVLDTGCRAGDQSFMVLHQAGRACCVSVRGAVFPATDQRIVKMVFETIIFNV